MVMIGKHPAKLDEKNRLILPAKMRGGLGEVFYATIGLNNGHKVLTIYTAEDWQKISENFNNLPLSKRGGAASLIFMYAVECIPDKQFRFALNPQLLSYAGITRDVVLAGKGGQVEIWDAEAFHSFEIESMTPEMLLASMEELGI